jgi:hypothetical protein
MIFKRGRKRGSESAAEESSEDDLDELAEVADDEGDTPTYVEGEDLEALEDVDWRSSGPYDIAEVDSIESTEESPKIDLGSLILTAVPGSELRLQVAEETGEIVSAMLVIETVVNEGFAELSPVEPPDSAIQKPQAYSSALELGAYAAPRSGGLWAELRDEISRSATEVSALTDVGCGGSALAASGHRLRSGRDRRGRRLARRRRCAVSIPSGHRATGGRANGAW